MARSAKQRAALRKAQLASAAKRRGRHAVNVQHARVRRNLANRRAGLNLKQRSRNYRRFEAEVNHSRVHVLGKKTRSQANMNRRRVARTVGRHTVVVGSVALQYAASSPKGSRRVAKLVGTPVRGAKLAAATPYAAKGFVKGVRTSSARRAAAKRNLSRHDFNRAHSTRVGPLALTAGTGRGHQGRRVRGY